jgi:hypothetical protein
VADKYNQRWALWFRPDRRQTTNAITFGQVTYYSEPETKVIADAKWRRHENCHKLQWKRDGVVKFAFIYLWYTLRFGYLNNPYEIEAREKESIDG